MALHKRRVKRQGRVGDVALPGELKQSLSRPDAIGYVFEQLVKIVQELGYESTYIQVDRVDELTATSQDSQASWQLVRDLLVNLPVLETRGVGFKFFLWDQVREHFLEDGGRPDRVRTYELEWKVADLQQCYGAAASLFGWQSSYVQSAVGVWRGNRCRVARYLLGSWFA